MSLSQRLQRLVRHQKIVTLNQMPFCEKDVTHEQSKYTAAVDTLNLVMLILILWVVYYSKVE